MTDIQDYLNGNRPAPAATTLAVRSKWKPVTVDVELPSGNVVTMRPLGYDLVFKSARIPDFLTPLIIKAFKGEATDDTLKIDEMKNVQEFLGMLDSLCELAFVSPRVVKDAPGEDEITVDMIDFEDKTWVYAQIGKSRQWLEMFRPGQNPDVVNVDDEQNLPDQAEQTAEAEAAPPA